MRRFTRLAEKTQQAQKSNKLGTMTRSQHGKGRVEEDVNFNQLWTQVNTAKDIEQRETLGGVLKEPLNKRGVKTPIVFIIKNIKSFPHHILNDLIHLLKKYRAEQRKSYCLILGV